MTNEIVCRNGDCNGKTLMKQTSNLERHLKRLHTKIYADYISQKLSAQKDKSDDRIDITIKVRKTLKRQS